MRTHVVIGRGQTSFRAFFRATMSDFGLCAVRKRWGGLVRGCRKAFSLLHSLSFPEKNADVRGASKSMPFVALDVHFVETQA